MVGVLSLYVSRFEQIFRSGKKQKALETIKEVLWDIPTRDAFLEKIATSYYDEKILNKAFEAIQEVSYETETKVSLLIKIADAYEAGGDRNIALEIVKEVSRFTRARDVFIAKIACSYYEEGLLGKAFTMIKEVDLDTKARESLIVKIAEGYFSKSYRYRDLALSVICEICRNIDVKLPFLVKLAQSYYSDGEKTRVRRIINTIIQDSFNRKMTEIGNTKILTSIRQENRSTSLAENFFSHLTVTCYEQIKKHFASGSLESILQGIVTLSTDQSTIEDFLRLKKSI